jgi:DNA-binding NarL/FixJ family response regulator
MRKLGARTRTEAAARALEELEELVALEESGE